MSSEDAIISEELELVFSPKSKILVTNVYKKDNLMIIEGEYRDASMWENRQSKGSANSC